MTKICSECGDKWKESNKCVWCQKQLKPDFICDGNNHYCSEKCCKEDLMGEGDWSYWEDEDD